MIEGRPLQDALQNLGYEAPRARTSVGGGCIANGQRLVFPDGRKLFLKSGPLSAVMFTAEAAGLACLAGSGTRVHVPRPLAVGPESDPYLLLESVESGERGPAYADELGVGLVEIHRTSNDRGYGFDHDSFIGSTPQSNEWSKHWIEFFGEQRLRFQLEIARRNGRLDGRLGTAIESIIDRLGDLLPEPERSSLIHGDLWGGNLMSRDDGVPVLIDPAVYYGHREADLAMTRLFGGFPARFYDSYREAWPLEPGFDERVDLYNLYHMLNHLNLFGGGYLGGVQSIVRRYSL